MFALLLTLVSAHASLDLCQPPSFVAGQPVEVQVTGANPGENVIFVRGAGPGLFCPPALGGACLELAAPTILAQVRADASGTASYRATLPTTMPSGVRIAIQAAVVRGPGGAASLVSDAFFTATRRFGNDCASGNVCASPDADHDLVHDVCDVCPGGDDHVDGDADGVPDGCDAFPTRERDMVAYWPLDGDGADASGHGHDASNAGGVPVMGAVAGAMYFANATHMDIPASPDFDLNHQLTFGAWVLPDGHSLIQGLLCKATRSGPVQDWGFYIWDRDLAFDSNFPAAEQLNSSAGAGLIPGVWAYVTITVDVDLGVIGYYVNGALVQTALSPLVVPIQPSDLVIGTDGATPHDLYGAVDEMRLWSRVLEPWEIAAFSAP